MKRTHTCGELNLKNINEVVTLFGWVRNFRKMGSLNFIDLADQYGITQLVLEEKKLPEIELKSEYTIKITGLVVERKAKNLLISTGEIEIIVNQIELINKSEVLPFRIADDIETREESLLLYRYLDLRRPEMQKRIILRSLINQKIRTFLSDQKFIEIETPILAKSTPEGARDFLVPSRLNEGQFYALPQSPQLLKQLLMVSGFDRYYQIVKCFRDEDLRLDRQFEFTQLDMEMNFSSSEDVMAMIEALLKFVIKEVKQINYEGKFPIITYAEAIDKYGSDKPDTRFGYEIKTLNEIFATTAVTVFNFAKDKSIRAIFVDSLLQKKDLTTLAEIANQNSLKIFTFVKISNGEWSGSIASQLSNFEKEELIRVFHIKKEGTILIGLDHFDVASKALGAIRNELAKILNLLIHDKFNFLWVIDFPLFEFSKEENRYVAAHHPFTMPKQMYLNNFDTDLKQAKAEAYDIVLNGFEIGGGSQRIVNEEIQKRMFKAIGLSTDQVQNKFGWFIKAYQYGAPFHSGCALGLDRLVMILTGAKNIREVIAFPKNHKGIDLMMDCPSNVSEQQLNELHIMLKK